MKFVYGCILLFAASIYWMLFGGVQYEVEEIAHFPIDGTARLSPDIDRVAAAFDPEISSDHGGSLRIRTEEPTFVELAGVEGNGEDLSFRELHYQARVKTEDAEGPVFLVMQAGVHGGMPVIGIENSLMGTNDWTTIHVAAGNPAQTFLDGTTRLQLEISGSGTVWIDDLRLITRRAR